MLSWLSLRCGGAGWSATIQLGRAMACATRFRGGQRRGKRGSGVWTCGGRVGSVRMACFTHLIPLPWRLEPGHGTAGGAQRGAQWPVPRAFAADRGVANVVPVFGLVAVKWDVCAWPASPSQRRPWHLEPGRGTAGTWCTEGRGGGSACFGHKRLQRWRRSINSASGSRAFA